MQAIFDALRSGAHAEALSLATAAVEAQPEDAQALRALALAQRANGDGTGARASIERAIALAPDDADLHFQLAGFLLGERDAAAAAEALATTVRIDPNQFGAYFLQAQMAIARRDLAEAERISRLAARVAPDHPWQRVLEGTLALRRGDHDTALAQLGRASEQAPEDVQVRYALGFAYLAKGHLAFAEQAFRGVLAQAPSMTSLCGLIASLLVRQGRPEDAVVALAPLLNERGPSASMLHAFAGELELAAGRPDRARVHLGTALAADPGNGRALGVMVEVWRRQGDAPSAREALDAAIAASPGIEDLWRARLSFEAAGSPLAEAVIERWQAAEPTSIAAQEARMVQRDAAGDAAGAEAAARGIVDLRPGHGMAQERIFTGLLERDPAAAIEHVEALLAGAGETGRKRLLRTWLAFAHDRADHPDAAVVNWLENHAEMAPHRLPLPPTAPEPGSWPERAPEPGGHPQTVFLAGAPGSGVERLAVVLAAATAGFRADRLGATPPGDAFQNMRTPDGLARGDLDPAAVVEGWRRGLPARGIQGEIVDWLLWWDNALAVALRPCLPEAILILALRDPRDMLLDWLAYGSPTPFAMASVEDAAIWLSGQLEQAARLHEEDLVRHRLVRLDGIEGDPAAIAAALGEALETTLPVVPAGTLGDARLPAGRWRRYADVLAPAFATLAPVARRLGYDT